MKHITIDGPAASGKSTTADLVANKLGFGRLNAGNLYRAVTYILYIKGLDVESEQTPEFINDINLTLKDKLIIYDNLTLNQHLRSKYVENNVARISTYKYIRDLVSRQLTSIVKESNTNLVLDGRVMGTEILPSAYLKIYLTASVEERAMRRCANNSTDYNEILNEIKKRDDFDINRKHGPLRPAEDGFIVKNDNMTINETVEKIIELFHQK